MDRHQLLGALSALRQEPIRQEMTGISADARHCLRLNRALLASLEFNHKQSFAHAIRVLFAIATAPAGQTKYGMPSTGCA